MPITYLITCSHCQNNFYAGRPDEDCPICGAVGGGENLVLSNEERGKMSLQVCTEDGERPNQEDGD